MIMQCHSAFQYRQVVDDWSNTNHRIISIRVAGPKKRLVISIHLNLRFILEITMISKIWLFTIYMFHNLNYSISVISEIYVIIHL